MILSDDAKAISAIEKSAAAGASAEQVLAQLRAALSLDAFGLLMIELPRKDLPAISRLLPAMASDESQRNFTGNAGVPLLGQTLSFVRALAYNYAAIRNRSLKDARILDYGCGYGRISRLMYYYTDPAKLWAVDPWDVAIDLCKDARLLGNLAQSDYLPKSLPAPEGGIDVMFAFSVFTHTSRSATDAALGALRKHIADDGLLAITIRSPEYWRADPTYAENAKVYEKAHAKEGFAYAPHQRDTVEGEATYGDTSMTLDFIQRNYPDWKIAGTDWSMTDYNQRYVFLQPA
jgi:SAM-dependent methyltransferase